MLTCKIDEKYVIEHPVKLHASLTLKAKSEDEETLLLSSSISRDNKDLLAFACINFVRSYLSANEKNVDKKLINLLIIEEIAALNKGVDKIVKVKNNV